MRFLSRLLVPHSARRATNLVRTARRAAAAIGSVATGLALLAALALAACGSSSSTANSGAPPTVSSSSTARQPVVQSTTPANTGAVAATFSYSDSDGDSETQTFAFGSPVVESDLLSVAQAADSCQLGEGASASSSANIVVPVSVVTTLNSDIDVNMAIALQSSPMMDGGSAPLPLNEVIVYNTSQGYFCAAGNNANGTDISQSLTEGQPVDLSAWVVLDSAISPDYPDGNPGQIGVSGITPQVNPGFSTTATVSVTGSGAAICTSASAVYTPFLHIGGTTFGWQDCNGKYSSN
jgi:hypothetical protein